MNITTSHQGTILIVDDIPENVSVLFHFLSDEGFKVLVAQSWEQALRIFGFTRPDIILLDIMMPGKDGFEICELLKSQENTKDIPIIFMTALTEIVDKVKGFELGAADYITKPIQQEEVLARINAHLKIHKLQLQLQAQNQQLQQQATLLQRANLEISSLNQRLKAENMRLSAELEITRRLQQMILPKEEELNQVAGLEIACFMEPADEVGGDYYDVLQHEGRVICGIGDVTGHGLESAVLMLMVQTAVRTLLTHNETEPVKFLNTLNRVIYDNVQRMSIDKNLTFALLDYQLCTSPLSQSQSPKGGILRLTGQHEDMIVVRSGGGSVELIDTVDLGFPIGLEEDIAHWVAQTWVSLNPGDVAVLYTDGITEAENLDKKEYGLERLKRVIKQNGSRTAGEIRQTVIDDVRQHIGEQKVFDDITLLVLKQK
jgi:serine phosphatase RsbU (regulator of sigma subunit)